MNRFGLVCFASAAVAMTASAMTLEKMVVRQQAPWNNLVRIEFCLQGGAGEFATVDCAVKKPDGTLVCDTATSLAAVWGGERWDLTPGYHVLTWNPTAAGVSADARNLAFELRLKQSQGKYMIVDISNPAAYTVSYANDIPAEALTEEKTPGMDSNVYRETKIVLRHINPGVFMMGSPETEFGHPTTTIEGAFLETQHQVTLTNEFWIGVFPMSYGQFKHVCPDNTHVYWDRSYTGQVGDGQGFASSIDRTDLLGAGSVTKWPQSSDVDEAEDVAFIPRLRNRTKGQLPTGFVFSLPTEAQWEYACRAGTTTAFNDGSDCVLEADGKTCLALDALGYYKESGRNFRIGAKKPNAWGLYDCHGGVLEIVNDLTAYDLSDPGTASVVEPKGLNYVQYEWGRLQIVRGGSGWDFPAIIPLAGTAAPCRSAARTVFLDHTRGAWGHATDTYGWTSAGFRLAVIREVQNGVEK